RVRPARVVAAAGGQPAGDRPLASARRTPGGAGGRATTATGRPAVGGHRRTGGRAAYAAAGPAPGGTAAPSHGPLAGRDRRRDRYQPQHREGQAGTWPGGAARRTDRTGVPAAGADVREAGGPQCPLISTPASIRA